MISAVKRYQLKVELDGEKVSKKMQVENNGNTNKDFQTEIIMDLNTNLDDNLNRIAKKEGFISFNVNKKQMVDAGGNYFGLLYKITITGNTVNGDKEISIVAKCMSEEAANVEIMLSIPDMYKRELFIYTELGKIFHELQDEANVPIRERYNTVTCYEESHAQTLFLDDLTREGYKTWFRMDIVTLEMAETCLDLLARYHGISYVLQQRRPEYFNEKVKTIETTYVFKDEFQNMINKHYRLGIKFLDDDVRSNIEIKLKDILNKAPYYFLAETEGSCLCHGDYRPNNVMIKEVDGKVTEGLQIDYQFMFYGCPLIDFFYFIYTATDSTFRSAHLEHLKEFYYNSLERFLQNFDISAESVLPRSVFENFYKEKRDFGLMVTFLFLPFMYVVENDEVSDASSVIDMDLKVDDRYVDRLKTTIQEMIELGYL